MWLPDWLYRPLPFIYTIFGLLCLFYTGSWMGYVAGAMLLMAALIIWKLRKAHKEMRKEQSSSPM